MKKFQFNKTADTAVMITNTSFILRPKKLRKYPAIRDAAKIDRDKNLQGNWANCRFPIISQINADLLCVINIEIKNIPRKNAAMAKVFRFFLRLIASIGSAKTANHHKGQPI